MHGEWDEGWPLMGYSVSVEGGDLIKGFTLGGGLVNYFYLTSLIHR
jgi:hypothetical protein